MLHVGSRNIYMIDNSYMGRSPGLSLKIDLRGNEHQSLISINNFTMI